MSPTRLLPLAPLALIALAACDEGQAPTGAPPGRVVAVAAEDPDARPLEELCDFLPAEGAAPAFTPPVVVGEPVPTGNGWRWVNVWATWCRPCVEELPMLARFQRELGADGHTVDLRFVSSDVDAETVTRFRAEHPDTPESSRMEDPSSLPTWVTSVGLDQGAALPLHVFVDPGDRVRCARAGAISERDLPLVRRLVSR